MQWRYRYIVRMSTGGARSDGDHMAPTIESVMYVLTVWQGPYTGPTCEIYQGYPPPHHHHNHNYLTFLCSPLQGQTGSRD